MRNANYDLATLDDCVKVVRSIRWRIQKKEDHVVLCQSVHKAFDVLYEKTHSALFAFDCGPGLDYQEAVEANVKKSELDLLARDCREFLIWELSAMREKLYDSLE